MSFVEEEYQVIALYAQNELQLVEPGNQAEFTLKTYPGRVIKAKVDSIVWAQGQGQVAQSGMLPQTGAYPQVPGRFPVKLDVAERDRDLFLAAGADGAGAIYTDHAAAIHILRMVILRVGTITDLPRAEAALMGKRLACRSMLAAALAAAVAGCALNPPPTTAELQKDALPHTARARGVEGRRRRGGARGRPLARDVR